MAMAPDAIRNVLSSFGTGITINGVTVTAYANSGRFGGVEISPATRPDDAMQVTKADLGDVVAILSAMLEG